MATLVLKEMEKFLWEGREKVCPVSCLSLILLIPQKPVVKCDYSNY